MSESIYIIPESGKRVRDPQRGDHLPEEGRSVPDTSYWRRRLKDGDVRVGRKPAAKKAARETSKESAPATTGSDS